MPFPYVDPKKIVETDMSYQTEDGDYALAEIPEGSGTYGLVKIVGESYEIVPSALRITIDGNDDTVEWQPDWDVAIFEFLLENARWNKEGISELPEG